MAEHVLGRLSSEAKTDKVSSNSNSFYSRQGSQISHTLIHFMHGQTDGGCCLNATQTCDINHLASSSLQAITQNMAGCSLFPITTQGPEQHPYLYQTLLSEHRHLRTDESDNVV